MPSLNIIIRQLHRSGIAVVLHKKSRFSLLALCLALLFPSVPYAEQGLSINMAEQMALQYDPMIKSFDQRMASFNEQAVSVNTWPDPKMRFGFLSVPTDTYDLDQEPMTQMIVGYQQMLPRGDSLDYMVRKMRAKADQSHADMQLRKRQVMLNTRKAWLEVYLQEQMEKIVLENRHLFKQQVEVSQSLYGAGKSNQQDVLQAELELSLLDDQLQKIIATKKESRSALAQWVGDEVAGFQLENGSSLFSDMDVNNIVYRNRLQQHPVFTKQAASVIDRVQDVSLAKQRYKPQWGFDVAYGKRDGNNADGSERADFFSALVTLDMPVFNEDRQDRELAASKKELLSESYKKQDLHLQLVVQLEQAQARWQQLTERLELYDQRVLKQARENARAALNGYQSGVVPFLTLTRARSAELKARLQRLQLYVEKAQVYAQLRYLIGDDLQPEILQ
ncbi:MAG TPA: TolC family protein [Gammaproteobacteria bacterium]